MTICVVSEEKRTLPTIRSFGSDGIDEDFYSSRDSTWNIEGKGQGTTLGLPRRLPT